MENHAVMENLAKNAKNAQDKKRSRMSRNGLDDNASPSYWILDKLLSNA